MTYSVLLKDRESGALGAAAATGAYCVGGWVIRGRWDAGLSASQGASPSVYWGEDVLELMQKGKSATEAVNEVVSADDGRDYRQLSALDCAAGTASFTGQLNTPQFATRQFENGIALGNMLASPSVIDSLVEAVLQQGELANRLMCGLEAAFREGGDIRGLKSASLLILYPDYPPLSLRIDADDTPLAALRNLHQKATSGEYAAWLPHIPDPSNKKKVPQLA